MVCDERGGIHGERESPPGWELAYAVAREPSACWGGAEKHP